MNSGKRQQPISTESLINAVEVKPERHSSSAELDVPKSFTEKPMFNEQLMEMICDRSNLQRALKRVCRNRGAPGIDGMTVDDLKEHLKANWLTIKAALLQGSYQPWVSRCVEIPKPDGKGKRMLSIPCALDRFIQQALLQVLQKQWDKKFSANSFGFRPRRSAHQGIAQAQSYIKDGYDIVVDVDLENFFTRVNHDKLMSKLAKEILDKRVLKLIRAYLKVGIMDEGLVKPMTEGVAQGSPLSPFLSNVVLDDLDKELANRGHRYARYGDDVNIYVKSQRAGERVMQSISRYIEQQLKLKVNQNKSAVATASKRSFLGFSFTKRNPYRDVCRKISPKALTRLKTRVCRITRRRRGISMEMRIAELSKYLIGWRSYYGYCQTRSVLVKLDSWVRHRLRAVHWKQWKTFKGRRKALLSRGLDDELANLTAGSSKGPWRSSRTAGMHMALSSNYFDELSLPRLAVS